MLLAFIHSQNDSSLYLYLAMVTSFTPSYYSPDQICRRTGAKINMKLCHCCKVQRRLQTKIDYFNRYQNHHPDTGPSMKRILICCQSEFNIFLTFPNSLKCKELTTPKISCLKFLPLSKIHISAK